jgi:hypothetical protein
MKKSILFIGIFLIFVGQAFASDLVINQVLYDPINTESGGEAIEIYNPTNKTINLEGYYFRTESSEVDVSLPDFNLKPSQSYLVADADWSEDRDSFDYPLADHEEAISMTNSDAGVALMLNESLIDAIGWGNASNIEEGLFLGTPSASVASGSVLQRVSYLNDNSLDFVEAAVSFRNSSYSEEVYGEDNIIDVSLSVSNNAPEILGITVDDDLSEEGLQIIPNVGTKRQVNFELDYQDLDGAEDVDYVEVSFLGEKTYFNDSFGYVNLDYFSEAKEYLVNVKVVDKSNASDEINFTFEYQEMIGLIVDSNSFSINGSQGEEINILGDLDLESENNPTIMNAGNVELDLGVIGEGISDVPLESSSLIIGNLSSVINDDLNVVNLGLNKGSLESFDLRFKLREDAIKSDSSFKISLIGVA